MPWIGTVDSSDPDSLVPKALAHGAQQLSPMAGAAAPEGSVFDAELLQEASHVEVLAHRLDLIVRDLDDLTGA